MTRLESIALIAPLALLSMGFLLPWVARVSPRRAARLTALGASVAFLVAIAVAGALALSALGMLDPSGLEATLIPSPIGIRLDALTAIMLFTVSSIGLVVSYYAIRYLDADVAQRRFSTWLAFSLSAVLSLVLASNLLVFFAAWVATSHGLHQLLTVYGDRPAARLAARKKFLISRIGDLFLGVAFVWIYQTLGTFEFSEIFAQAQAVPVDERARQILPIAVLIVLGAMTKSAQFPVHSWLPETMEAPTPVSAMMHAGIINAGGFLVIRMSPLIALAPSALAILALFGGLTAVFGSVVMLTQTDVKKKLAFSTVSQMGFMMLQCGVGAFSAATLHLVGHSFYKAHAFLSAGSWVDPHPAQLRPLATERRVGSLDIVFAVFVAALLVLLSIRLYGLDVQTKPGLVVLGGILALGLAQLLLFTKQIVSSLPFGLPYQLAGIVPAAAIALLYFGGFLVFDGILDSVIGRLEPQGRFLSPTGSAVLLLFLGALFVQARKPEGGASPRWARFYVHAHNGFYIGTVQSRLVDRLWPVRTPATRP